MGSSLNLEPDFKAGGDGKTAHLVHFEIYCPSSGISLISVLEFLPRNLTTGGFR